MPRGGIIKERIYIDETFVWGKGLVHAHNLEDKVAVYPRIIIDKSCISDLTTHQKEQLLSIDDKDGKEYLNYLNTFGNNTRGHLETVQEVKNWLTKEISSTHDRDQKNDFKKQVSILEKLEWLKNYIERFETEIINRASNPNQ